MFFSRIESLAEPTKPSIMEVRLLSGVVDQISLRINDAIYGQQLASEGHT